MNQPRYSDHNPSNNSNSGSRRRGVSHSTGRSNYGASSSNRRSRGNNSNNNNKQGNAIGNWIKNRRQRRQQQNNQQSSAVGTEANAIQNMKDNAKFFSYPPEGFITPIEHSLLYAMINYPDHYPEAVVKNEIDEEEFDIYLYVNDTKRKGTSSSNSEVNEGEDQQSSPNNKEEERVSYAQLSAILSLSSEKNPSRADPNQNSNTSDTRGNSESYNSRTATISTSTSSVVDTSKLSIGQALCRKLLKVITRYCDANNLDREAEVAEFLNPIEKRCRMRNEKAALQQLLPAYAGYALSLATGNPLPLLIGAAALTGPDKMHEENSNVVEFRSNAGRVGNLETAGLLDECDSD